MTHPSAPSTERLLEMLAEYERRSALNPLSGMSWGNGFNVWGDEKSMTEVRAAVHSHGQIDEFRTLIRHQREEIGKLHAQVRTADERARRALNGGTSDAE